MNKTLSEARNELRGKHYKLSSYLKKAAQIKVNNISTDTPAHLACNLARDEVFCRVDERRFDNFTSSTRFKKNYAQKK